MFQNGEFDIDSIRSKLIGIGNGDALNIGAILIVSDYSDEIIFSNSFLKTSESDIDDLGQTLKNQISQLNPQVNKFFQ